MSDTKFTKGPLVVEHGCYAPEHGIYSMVISRNEKEIGPHVCTADVFIESDANLYAASPELYEMLQIARDYVQGELEEERQAYKGYESSSNIHSIEEDLNRIDAALAKARGEV